MMNFVEASPDVSTIKPTDVKTPEIPKEIGENKSSNAEIPKEIGENKQSVAEIPKEIGESTTPEAVPNSQYELDGHTYYTDDNGDVYRIDNDLVYDSSYEINDYKYTTDEKGRISSAEGTLQLNHENKEKIKDNISEIGKGDEKPTDDRGHVIGRQFGGANEIGNLVPQDAKINQGDYKNLETQLAKEVGKGNDVKVNVELNYPEGSYRPDCIVVNYSINGESFVRIFPNES